MGLIKEPFGVDVVDPRKLTKKEELTISEFIKADKAKRVLKQKRQNKVRNLNIAKEPA
jgi:hypothetical protein